MWCVGLGTGRGFCLLGFDFKFLDFFPPTAFSVAEGFFPFTANVFCLLSG